ncbi:HAD-IIIA family hydrolase [Nocardiopsis sp. NRRL B-16309]|uniref:HAD-IIIA family hydrolase n=1 Tax=Nocardiopsis sp. NRRL B-16309 TaxID=1519494 RepID=UPI0006ADA2F6|nr:HAD-IIIA family hydrolase [Nocardiopsis sp. NRRL B-16309]KOX18211.1 HAD family hydrolase [Nocardiopsis sp. NRRL B-16309]
MSRPEYAVVVPTVGRDSLHRALAPLLEAPRAWAPAEIVVVDDRPGPANALPRIGGHPRVRVLRGGGHGPAAARQAGWHSCRAEWIAFLDDDVHPPADWPERLCSDLAAADEATGGVQGRITVPRPEGRRPTDGERATLGLEGAPWITADMAYRRGALEAVGGFDTRFPRAYREDTDLALRVLDAGFSLRLGERECEHPLRPGRRWGSLAAQRGNADDTLMDAVHGRGWRVRVGEEPGGLRGHVLTTGLLAGAAAAVLARRPLPAGVLGAGWLARTAGFALRRATAGPADPAEVVDMVVTSVLIPPLACGHRIAGALRHAGARRAPGVRAVLFDRDGTLIEDVPYNGDPDKVRPTPGAADAVALARRAGLAVGVVSNQSGIARGLLAPDQVDAVNRRVDELLGPFDVWRVCPHGEQDGCACRKPRPGMVESAAAELGVAAAECAVVGDIGSDMAAARAAGARGVLVPTRLTREEERRASPETEPDPASAVLRLVRGSAP